VEAASVMAEAGETGAVVRTPVGEHRFKLPFVEDVQPRTTPWPRSPRCRARIPAGCDGGSGARDSLLAPSWGAGGAPGGSHPDQRLLQRQPDLDAGGAGPSRLALGRGSAACGAGGDAGARAGRGRLSPRDRRVRARARASS
jgi:hypothetical protein